MHADEVSQPAISSLEQHIPTKKREYKLGTDPVARKRKYNGSEKGKEARAKYTGSDKGKDTRANYYGSDEGKDTIAKYSGSDKGKETRAKYNGSDKGKETSAEHAQSEDRIASKVKYNLSVKADWQKRAYEDSLQGVSRRLKYSKSAKGKQTRKSYNARNIQRTSNANDNAITVISNLIEKHLKSLDTDESEIRAVDDSLKSKIEDDLHRHLSGLSLDECCCVVCDALSLAKTSVVCQELHRLLCSVSGVAYTEVYSILLHHLQPIHKY